MTKEILQQALDEARSTAITVFTHVDGLAQETKDAIEYLHSLLSTHFKRQALAQQEQCGCREGECETKKDKACRMTIEIAERDGIPEWTPAIGIECAISNLRDDAARLRDGGYTPLQIADDLDVIANDLAKCKPDTQQEPHPPSRLCMCDYCAPSFDDNAVHPDAKAQQEQPASVDAYVGASGVFSMTKVLLQRMLDLLEQGTFAYPTKLREDIKQALAQQEQLGEMLACDIDARPLNHPLRDYHIAPSDGPLNSTWQDKPHRLLYDLIAAVKYYAKAQQEQPTQEASATWTEMVVANLVREGVNKHRARELAAHFLTLPTQPALSDKQILDIFGKVSADGIGHYMLAVGRAIEAHCRGGVGK